MAGKKDIVEQALKLVTGASKGGGDEALRRYMSPSHIKDVTGNPIRLYHATPNTFDAFNVNQQGDSGPAIFLSPYADRQPAMHNTGGAKGQFKEGTNVMPVYARIQSPLVIDTPDMLEWSRNVYGSEFPHFISPEARKNLIDDGYDGVVFGGYKPQEYATGVDIGKQPHGDEEVIALHPEQVKSAISNEGTYDPADPRINKDAGGRTGYQTKGRVVEKALKAVTDYFAPSTDEYAANLGKFYGSTDPALRKRFYTGTSKDKDFTAFQESRHGTWLTDSPEDASSYALSNDSMGYRPGPGWTYEKTNQASRVIPAYAKIENPYRGEKPDWVMKQDNYKKAQSDWFDQLRAQGYDAWVPDSGNGGLAVVLKGQGTNVKSAIGNQGTFDPTKKHMGKSEGGRTGYGPGGVIDDIVKMAGRIVSGADEPAKKAFGETYLKTPQGDPMRLYHMTPEDIFEFRASPESRSGPAVFLSPYPDFQPAYHQSAERGPAGELTSQFKEGANVMPVYADVRNPLVLDHPRKIKEAAAKYQGGDPQFPRIISPEARAAMEAEGYDGIVFGGDNPIPYGDRPMDARLGFQEGRGEEFLVFDPKRVKSAISNTGEYDFANPDITKADGGQVRDGYAGRGRVVESAIDLARKELARLKSIQPDDAAPILRGDELIAKSRNFEGGIPLLGSERYGARLDEMSAQYEGVRKLKDFLEKRPHDLVKEGAVIYPAVGDLSAAGKRLTKVGETPLVTPTDLHGGFEFSRDVFGTGDNPAAWASRPVAARLMADRIATRTGEGEVPYLTSVAMGIPASDSTHMVANTLISMVPNSKIAASDIAKFDAEMSSKFEGWPGILNTEEVMAFMDPRKRPGTQISQIAKVMDKAQYRKAGFPDPAQVRFAVSEPRLLGLPQGSSGFTLMGAKPSGETVTEGFQHGTYANKIPSEEGYSGGFRNVTPSRLMFPEWYGRQLDKTKADPTLLQQSMMTQFPKQKATNEWADSIEKYWEENPMPWGYAYGGEVDDDDIDDAIRIAKDVGGSTSVMMEDAKGNKYDAQGNVIPPQNPGPQPARSDLTPEQVGRQAAQDPATYDALMERYAVPDRDIAEYEAVRSKVAEQPQATQQMTHVGDRPRREMKINMPLFGGEYSMGTAPYDVAEGMQGAAQTAYDFKTMPAYFFPATAPFALGADVLESRMADDPLGLALNLALTPQGFSAAKSAVDLVRRNPKTVAAAVGAGSYLSPDEAQAGPERWFSKLFRAAEALPMEKMTGEQALAMLRKSAPQEEIKWTGLENFASNNPVTTKQALLDFIRRNQVQTQDIVLGSGPKPTRREDVVPDEEIRAKYSTAMSNAQNALARHKLAMDEATKAQDVAAYREAERSYMGARNGIYLLETASINEQIAKMGGLGRGTKYQSYSTPGGEGYRETLVTLPGEKIYKSPHWDDPNVIGHIRSQMLTATPPGANRPLKLFNVDENQSDLAQAGRKEGFKNQEAIAQVAKMREEINQNLARSNEVEAKLSAEHYARIKPIQDARAAAIEEVRQRFRRGEISASELNSLADDAFNEFSRQIDPYADQYRRLVADQVTPIRNRVSELGKEIERIGSKIGRMPEAPYVTSTQGWTDFSIKKALDQAIDSGADYFTFTPGEVQAARYDLQKHLDTVNYNPRTGALAAYDPDGNVVFDEDILDEDLEQYVGQEIAERIRQKAKDLPVDEDSLRSRGSVRLTGVDLKTGGEGMIDYYNNIYKRRVEKVVKDLTGKKVQWEVLPAETAEGIVPRLGFRIDDDLREAKFPTFASGGTVSRALELTRDY